MITSITTLAMLAAASAAAPAAAPPRLDPMFGDHAVLQRDQPITVTGTADAGVVLTVTLGAMQARATADTTGRFTVTLPRMPAGGPYQLVVTGGGGAAAAEDILIGDVVLCSGQSNMELSVARAQDSASQIAASADPLLRLFTVGKRSALLPRRDFIAVSGWAAAGPTTTGDFSAACFYMAKDLRRSAGVAIGAIHASWGGSRISTWMDDAALAATGQGDAARLRTLYARDPGGASTQAGAAWERWWRTTSGDAAGREPWQADAALDWKPVPRIAAWEDWGVPALADYTGMMWFRNAVTLTPAQARQAATLSIGPVDDADQSWVNGKPVGSGGNPGTPRDYPLAPGILAAGRNMITVNANDVYAKGGMLGPASLMMLRFADGSSVPLGSGWSYAVEPRRPDGMPRAPWDDTAGAGTIYNAMIAPLGRIGLKGVAWYQGESDVGIPGYADRLRAMMAGWRAQFGVPDLPFAIVQLAAYGTPASRPGASGWAALREEQRRAATADPHAALALTIDLGDPLDIHPGEKHEVGRRLARAMRHIAYADPAPAAGAVASRAVRSVDGAIVVTFSDVTSALVTRSSDRAIGFELCGTTDDSCRYAAGRIAGPTVTLAADGLPVRHVRYAWADSPVVNLYDESGLPAGPFDLPLQP